MKILLTAAMILTAPSAMATPHIWVDAADSLYSYRSRLIEAATRPGYAMDTLASPATPPLSPGDYDVKIRLELGKWDDGSQCFNGECRCSLSVSIRDGRGGAAKETTETWSTANDCEDGIAKAAAVIGQIPAAASPAGYDLGRTLAFAQCGVQLDFDRVMAGIADRQVDVNYECTRGDQWGGKVIDSSLIHRLIYGLIERSSADCFRGVCTGERLSPSRYTEQIAIAIQALAARADLDWNRRGRYAEGGALLSHATSMHAGGWLPGPAFAALVAAAPVAAFNARIDSRLVRYGNYALDPITVATQAALRREQGESPTLRMILGRRDLRLGSQGDQAARKLAENYSWDDFDLLTAHPSFVADAALVWDVIRPFNTSWLLEILMRPSIDVNRASPMSFSICRPPLRETPLTLLQWAAWYGDFDLVRALLSRHDVDKDAVNACGETAAMIAARGGRADIRQAIENYRGNRP